VEVASSPVLPKEAKITITLLGKQAGQKNAASSSTHHASYPSWEASWSEKWHLESTVAASDSETRYKIPYPS